MLSVVLLMAFWTQEDTKVLLAWAVSADRMVISFRGTASLANVRADLRCWLSGALNPIRLILFVKQVHTALSSASWYGCTGHV